VALPDSDLPDKDAIVAALSRGAARPLKPKELARELDVSTSDYRDFKDLLRALEDAGDIYRVHGGRYAPPDVSNLITGTLRVNSSGNGFVVPDGAGDDVFVAAADMDTALHGDKVIVKVERRRRHAPVGGPGRSGGTEGRVTKILARARTQFVGTVTRTRTTVVVTPADPRIARDVLVPLDQTLDAEDRQKVVVEVLSFGDYGGTPRGRIIEVLGNEGDPGVDVLAIIRHHNLPDAIPAEVEAAAHALPATIPPEEIARREDWRGVLVVTIDPVDARDFDDALSLRRLDDDRWELGVHIADVSHYVKAGDTIDLEAYRRATSVYLVDRVIPMLPERLSNDLCSLKPEVDRLAMSVVMTVDAECRVQESRIADTVIHSRHRLTYEKVQAILEGDAVLRREYAGALDMVEGLHRLARQLTARRSARGSLDFDLPESRVLLDKEGLPMDIQKTVRLESHRLIEEFMVLANESVARHLRKKRIAGLFRVHEEPDALKIEQLVELITPLGYSLKRGKAGVAGPGGRAARGKPHQHQRAAQHEARPLRRTAARALRPGLGRLSALHLAHPPLPRPHRAPGAAPGRRRRSGPPAQPRGVGPAAARHGGALLRTRRKGLRGRARLHRPEEGRVHAAPRGRRLHRHHHRRDRFRALRGAGRLPRGRAGACQLAG
jgi:ribonuclease R